MLENFTITILPVTNHLMAFGKNLHQSSEKLRCSVMVCQLSNLPLLASRPLLFNLDLSNVYLPESPACVGYREESDAHHTVYIHVSILIDY